MKEIVRTKYWELQDRIDKGEFGKLSKIVRDSGNIVIYKDSSGKVLLMDDNGVCFADKKLLK